MSPAKSGSYKECGEAARPTTKIQITDMDTVQEEAGNDSDDSSPGDMEKLRERTRAMLSVGGGGAEAPLVPGHSQPSSRRMSSDFDVKNLNTRRPSAIIAAFRRPSQALALCAATQRKFLDQVLPRSSRASTGSAQHDHAFTTTEIMGHDALSKALSALYAKLLVLLGLAFPVTEVIAKGVNDGYYQGFYLYLYTVSVLFVILEYATLVRQKAVSSIINTYGEHGEQEKFPEKTSPKVVKENITRYGSFYLRLGAIAFGIGSMVYSGLEFGEYFEMSGSCSLLMTALTPAVRMALTLLQMQFIFLNSKEIESCSHKLVQRFGLMHMIATNLCEWLYVLVEETKHEIHHLEHVQSTHVVSLNETLMSLAAHNETQQCRRANMMGALLQNASPFLFPCTIEYSLICAVILYEMWKEVKCTPEDFEKKLHPNQNKSSRQNSVTPEKILQQFAGMLGVSSPGTPGAALQHFSVDCSHAHRGLFSGILLIVLTIISLIMFFVLAGSPDNLGSGIFEVNICELILYAFSLVAVVVAFLQMRELTYKRKSGGVLCLDTSLLMLAQSGMFIYCMFSMIGSYHTLTDEAGSGLTGFFSELMSLLQTILQTLFIIDAWWRRCATREHRARKPGRQLVTFLLVGNMAMWAVNTLEKNRAEFRPAHLDFYGKWAWTIITHVSMPLAIFYRFHSTICLFEIWKNSYKSKPIYINV